MGLWGKKGDSAPAPGASAGGETEKAPATKETFMASILKREEDSVSAGPNTVIGKGAIFEGKLTFEGEVKIDGRFTGEVFSKDRLVVGEDAEIQAQINAGTVIVFGKITGDVKTTTLVELKTKARVKGNIETPALIIEKGVIFEGNCKMENLGKSATVTPLKAEEKKGT
jgi:cytoskeletal protein CcmA (bactofilin family)